MARIYVKGGVTIAIWAATACALIFSKVFRAEQIFSCYVAALLAGAAAYSTKQIWNPERWADLEASNPATRSEKKPASLSDR